MRDLYLWWDVCLAATTRCSWKQVLPGNVLLIRSSTCSPPLGAVSAVSRTAIFYKCFIKLTLVCREAGSLGRACSTVFAWNVWRSEFRVVYNIHDREEQRGGKVADRRLLWREMHACCHHACAVKDAF